MCPRVAISGLVCAIALVSPGAARGDAPALSEPEPVVVSTDGSLWPPQLTLDAAGEATVAWARTRMESDQPGVFAARGPRSGGPFGPTQKISSDSAAITLVGNPRGDDALAWWAADGHSAPRLAIAPAGEDFGTPEDVPIVDPVHRIMSVAAALTTDGRVLVGYVDYDDYAGTGRAVVALRNVDGSWSAPQVLSEKTYRLALAADGAGGLHAIWPSFPDGVSAEQGQLMYAADAGTDGQFGPGTVISAAGQTADKGERPPSLLSNGAGDLLAIWSGGSVPVTNNGSEADSAFRPAGQDWQPPAKLSGGYFPTGALNGHGDALVSWTSSLGPAAVFRPMGQDWGGVHQGTGQPANYADVPVAIDDEGNALAVSQVQADDGAFIGAQLLRRNDRFGELVELSPHREAVTNPAIAVDGLGNGLVVWAEPASPATVFARAYSTPRPVAVVPPTPGPQVTPPPRITALRARGNAFTFRSSRSTAVTVTVRGRHKQASQSSKARKGLNRWPYTGRMRGLLRRPGRYHAIIRLPGASRLASVTFRRR